MEGSGGSYRLRWYQKPVRADHHRDLFEFESWLFNIVNFVLSFFVWLIPLVRFKFPKLAALVYPITIIVIYYIAMRSLYATKRGRITWKGRAMENAAKLRWN